MSLQTVQQFLAANAPDIAIIELQQSTATVEQAAAAHQVTAGQIAKTLTLKIKGNAEAGKNNLLPANNIILLVTTGDARLDNKKMKAAFGGKASMLNSDEVQTYTGHPVGGVCPFGLATPLPVYCDISLQRYQFVMPAAGAIHSALRIAPQRLVQLTNAQWVDVCQCIP